MILKVRLEAMYKYKNKIPSAKNVYGRYKLALRYFKFLGERSKKNFTGEKGLIFNF